MNFHDGESIQELFIRKLLTPRINHYWAKMWQDDEPLIHPMGMIFLIHNLQHHTYQQIPGAHKLTFSVQAKLHITDINLCIKHCFYCVECFKMADNKKYSIKQRIQMVWFHAETKSISLTCTDQTKFVKHFVSRTAKHIHCAQNVKTARLCTEFNKSISNIFLICHIGHVWSSGTAQDS